MKNFIKNTAYILICGLFQLFAIVIRAQSITVAAVEPFSSIDVDYPIQNNDKDRIIQRMNQGQFKVLYNGSSPVVDSKVILSLAGEKKLAALEIKNNSNQSIGSVNVSIEKPQGTDVKMYQEVLVNDWYSNQNKNVQLLNFYGDPLLLLRSQGNTYQITGLRAKETIRIVFEIVSNRPVSGDLSFMVKSGNTSANVKYNYRSLNKQIPKVEFSSIAYNTINLSSGGELTSLLNDIGFTHLQVNPLPYAIFNSNGKITSGIDQAKTSSKAFRDIANNWIKIGGKVAIFWQGQYAKLAPLANGDYLKPYSPAWNNAFVNLLSEVISNLKKISPQFSENQVVIYLVDEVSAANLKKRGLSVSSLLTTNNAIKQAFPSIKTMVTFGFYSGDNEVNELLNAVDITVMHFKMPNKSNSNGENYTPYQTKMNYDAKVAKMDKHISWHYNVESGVKSDVRDFRLLPLVSSAAGMTGFSWWAFASHRGSTWTINRESGLNYSMYYGNEANNPLFKMWTNSLADQDRFIPSLRLKAARAGLLDAKLIIAIKKSINNLSSQDRQSFQKIVSELVKINANNRDNMRFPSATTIETNSNKLRELYSKL